MNGMNAPLLEVKQLTKYFVEHNKHVKAVDGVSLQVYAGETLGVVGESGCGKSTMGRAILRLIEPTAGQIHFDGTDLTSLSKEELRKMRRHIQMVFQDPFATLNPKHTIRKILSEPLIAHQVHYSEREQLIQETIEVVGLNQEHLNRYPHQFSGGQRQRIGIARALMLRPKLVIADEPVSALDVSIQSQILNLLQDLQEEMNLTYILISHDLGVVEYIADRVAVMYLGKIVEFGSKESLFSNPLHPYTQALLSAIPTMDPDHKSDRIILQGDIPSPANPPSGCAFHTRCPKVMVQCKGNQPHLQEVDGRLVSCHLYDNAKDTEDTSNVRSHQ